MKYKEYSSEIWDRIHQNLDLVLQNNSSPIAAFDADGTLWDMDFGEALFRYEIDHQLLLLPQNPWEHYEELKAGPGGPEKGFLWLAQIHKGHEISEVRNWSQKCLESLKPIPIFAEQKKLIEILQNKNIPVYVVTASVKWAVEPAAALLGISADHVIGVETKIQNGKITDELNNVVTYRQGKVQGLKIATNGKLPFLASGNTEGDLSLLESATHLRLAVSASSRDDKLFKTESQLAQIAQERNWLCHRFV